MAAPMRTVELLPLVPTTWMDRKRVCGEPRTVSSRRMRSRPKRMPNSSSDSRWSSACSSVQLMSWYSRQRLQLLAQARELVALALDDVRRRALDELGVAELALGAPDLRVEALARRGGAPRGRLDVDGVRREHGHHAAGDRDRRHGIAVLGPRHAREPRDMLGRGAVAVALDARRHGPA